MPASLRATIASAVSHTGDWHASRRRPIEDRPAVADSDPAPTPWASSRSSTMKPLESLKPAPHHRVIEAGSRTGCRAISE